MTQPLRPLPPYAPPATGDIEIVHSDPSFVIINKPAGLLSVPGRGPEKADCVQSRLQAQGFSALLVHRLDMETSGLMVFAETRKAQKSLAKQFQFREVSKTYEALVFGEDLPESGEVDAPLTNDWPNRPRQMVCHETGKPSLTRWTRLSQENGRTHVELTPETGRSHQLRVHMLALGAPILGDALYAHDEAFGLCDRLCLHATQIGFKHPKEKEPVNFTSSSNFGV